MGYLPAKAFLAYWKPRMFDISIACSHLLQLVSINSVARERYDNFVQRFIYRFFELGDGTTIKTFVDS